MSKQEVRIKTRAKINLTLDIVGKLPNGYHELRMIMHSLNIYDEIYIKPNGTKNCTVQSNLKYLPCDGRNIVIKSIQTFYEASGLPPEGFDVRIKKAIPVAAGLAGGSSNAAGTLLFLNNRYEQFFSEEQLLQVGKSIGADVPYCILGGTCLAEGIGEKLSPLPSPPRCHFVVAKPANRGISTKEIFSMVDVSKIQLHPDTKGMIQALKDGDLQGIARRLYNVMEPYTLQKSPDVESFKNAMLENGALGSIMSGSGNAVFGIFETLDKARKAAAFLRRWSKQVFYV